MDLLRSQLKRELPEADAVIAGLEEYDRALIESAGKLKVISRYGVGYDKVDLQSARKQQIAVTITPGANGDSVADLAVALMLACARNIPFMDQRIKSRNQTRPPGVEMWGENPGHSRSGAYWKG